VSYKATEQYLILAPSLPLTDTAAVTGTDFIWRIQRSFTIYYQATHVISHSRRYWTCFIGDIFICTRLTSGRSLRMGIFTFH